jgi:hypothetical protein
MILLINIIIQFIQELKKQEDIYLHDKKPYVKPTDIAEEEDTQYKSKYMIGDYTKISKVKKHLKKDIQQHGVKKNLKLYQLTLIKGHLFINLMIYKVKMLKVTFTKKNYKKQI